MMSGNLHIFARCQFLRVKPVDEVVLTPSGFPDGFFTETISVYSE